MPLDRWAISSAAVVVVAAADLILVVGIKEAGSKAGAIPGAVGILAVAVVDQHQT